MSFLLNGLYFFAVRIAAVWLDCQLFQVIADMCVTDILLAAVIFIQGEFAVFDIIVRGIYISGHIYSFRTVLTRTRLDN